MRSAATVRMKQSGKISDFYIKEALSYIEQNFQNNITIEGDTDTAFTEDVGKRYEAYGWHVQHVDLSLIHI